MILIWELNPKAVSPEWWSSDPGHTHRETARDGTLSIHSSGGSQVFSSAHLAGDRVTSFRVNKRPPPAEMKIVYQ